MSFRPWVLAAGLGTLLVAMSAGPTPWLNALGGAFTPPDFAQDVAAAQIVLETGNPYTSQFAARHARVLDLPQTSGYPYLPHPPFAVLLSVPFALLSFHAAAAVWFIGSLVLAYVLAVLLHRVWTGNEAKQYRRAAFPTFVALLLWPPVLYNLEKGQFSILLAVLLASAYYALEQKRSAKAGTLIGAAVAIKVFPALLAAHLLRGNRRTLIWVAVVAGVLTALPLIRMGSLSLAGFVHHSSGNVEYWQTWPAVTYSIYGAAARLCVGGPWALPLFRAPVLAPVLAGIAGIVLVVLAFAATDPRRGDAPARARFSLWMVLLVLLNPLSMGHNGVLLALPVVLVAQSLQRDARCWPKFAWAAGVVLVSIPRQTTLALAPPPVTPAQGLAVVALPMWGCLLLFAASFAAARSRPAPSSMPCSDATAAATALTHVS